MPVRRRFPAAVLTLTATGLAVGLTGAPAAAHGSMQNPLSRVEGCYLEGAEHPKSAACTAAVATGGTAALYDWMSLRIGDAAGRHRELIPDGKLCSAGSDTYRGLDLPRADWPATNLTSGADFTFRYRATAPHKGTFQLYITNGSYSPTKPLTWANLEPQPFLTVTDPQLVDGSYVLPGKVPAGKTGRQLIYAIWQRSDSPEAFYSCSDVVFDGSGANPGTNTGTGGSPVPTGGATATTPTTPTTAGGHDHGHAPAPTAPAPAGGATAPTAAPVPASAGTPAAPAAPATPTTAPTAPTPTAPAPAVPTPTGTAGTPVAAGAAGTTPATTAAAPDQLAQTGSDRSLGILASVGSAFLLAGATVAVLHRQRRRRAHAR
ncbi:lytic polysaccharide monooxygenase [Kitasatospora sp. CM 4170]|uniref:Lytic polysaccharide monooxygenase n=1 Tax=Kitasatospora aburaviensis TaxID=67265 RepID=A0ABW1EUS3_9ACTN|nr:lytic polysaccharide monooxygenase [Kitasatospora sp. CM 4170]WNM45933.1 lytic polysaccharide monooxygenase [Kitasatospora sp. CM 4170]